MKATRRYWFLLWLFLALSAGIQSAVWAQEDTTIESRELYLFGTIIDAQTRTPIPFVQIYDPKGQLLLTTDSLGNFFISYQPNLNIQVTMKKIGYFEKTINLDLLAERQTNPELDPLDWPTGVTIFMNSGGSLRYFLTGVDERFVPAGDTNFTGIAFAGVMGNFSLAFADRWLLRLQAVRQNYDLARSTTTGEVFSRLDQQYTLDINYMFPVVADFLELLVRQGFLYQQLGRNSERPANIDFLDADHFRQNIYFGLSAGVRIWGNVIFTLDANFSPISFINATNVPTFPKGLQWFNGKAELHWRFWRNFAAMLAYHHTTWFDPNRQYAQQYNGGSLGLRYEW